MGKYAIKKEFLFSELFTFPIIEPILPIAEKALGSIVTLPRSDRNVKVKRIRIPVRDAYINALLYTPLTLESEKNAPLLVYYHGGGFIYKSAPHHFRLMKQYARFTPCKVLLVDYRVAPAHKFPVPVNDCYDALKWAYRNPVFLGIDKNRIAIMGDSAGGALTGGVALTARDSDEVPICAMELIYPVTDCRMQTQSMKEFTDTPVWNAKLSKKMWELYMPAADKDKMCYGAPALAGDFSNLPDSYTETAEFDSLRDEGVNLYKSMLNAGNNAVLYETKGTMHAFDMTSQSKITKEAVARRTGFLKNKFYK